MASLTIKDIPPKLHRTLKSRAARNRRSLQAEILSTLEEAVQPKRVPADEMLERVREFRERVRVKTTDAEIRRFIGQGRS
jgi:plasmid stability protein